MPAPFEQDVSVGPHETLADALARAARAGGPEQPTVAPVAPSFTQPAQMRPTRIQPAQAITAAQQAQPAGRFRTPTLTAPPTGAEAVFKTAQPAEAHGLPRAPAAPAAARSLDRLAADLRTEYGNLTSRGKALEEEEETSRKRLDVLAQRIEMGADTGRWWGSRSTPQKILLAISSAAGGVQAGLGGGPNQALVSIDQAIREDIDLQERTSTGLYATEASRLKEATRAREATRAQLLDVANLMAKAIGASAEITDALGGQAGKILPAGTLEKISDTADFLDRSKELEALFGKLPTYAARVAIGEGLGTVGELRQAVGYMAAPETTKKVASYSNSANSLITDFMYTYSGKQTAQWERARIEALLPKLGTRKELATIRFRAVRKMLAAKIAMLNSVASQAGYAVPFQELPKEIRDELADRVPISDIAKIYATAEKEEE